MSTRPPPDLTRQTIAALEDGIPGLSQFCTHFASCSDLFEEGQDQAARHQLAAVIPPLRDFAGFCDAILENSLQHLPQVPLQPLASLNGRLEATVSTLLETAETGDVIGLADVLRLDLCEVMRAYEYEFRTLAEHWKEVVDG